MPHEVAEEIAAGGAHGFGIAEFHATTWLRRWPAPVVPMPLLGNSLDKGEASVIELALNERITHVCIDEPVGRRLARLCGLNVTGAVGGTDPRATRGAHRLHARNPRADERPGHLAE